MEEVLGRSRVLVVEALGRFYAIPLPHVIEIMRPLPVEGISAAPLFVRGISIVRGIPIPLVELGLLLGIPYDEASSRNDGRFVILRLGKRQVALSVDAVCGVRELSALAIQELPPLLQGVSNGFIEAITTLDAQMLVILKSGWRLPEEVWEPSIQPRLPQIPQDGIGTGEIPERA